MNGSERLKAELLAVQSLADLLERAEKCRALYEQAGMSLPEPLKRFLGELDDTGNGSGQAKAPSRMVIPAPQQPRPQEAGPDWIGIDIQSASPQSVVLAVLREASTALTAGDVAERTQAILPDVPKGSIANIGTKLHGREIERTKEGWVLQAPEKAPILFEGKLWGPASIFGKYEVAAHRREGILHVLSCSPGGLQASQLEEHLRRCSWLKAPVNKDLVKADIEYLVSERKIRRRGNSGKWELTSEGEE